MAVSEKFAFICVHLRLINLFIFFLYKYIRVNLRLSAANSQFICGQLSVWHISSNEILPT